MTTNLPDHEPVDVALAILASATLTLVLLFALWPPDALYWTSLADVVGDRPTLALVALLTVGLGAWLGRTTGFGPANLIVGGVIAYLIGMAGIEVTLAPDSPVHLVLYAILLAGVLGGAIIWIGTGRYLAEV